MHLQNMVIGNDGNLVATYQGARGAIPLVQDPYLVEKGFLQLGESWRDQSLDVTVPPDAAWGQSKPQVIDGAVLDVEAFADYSRAFFYARRGYVGEIPPWGQALKTATATKVRVGATDQAPDATAAPNTL